MSNIDVPCESSMPDDGARPKNIAVTDPPQPFMPISHICAYLKIDPKNKSAPDLHCYYARWPMGEQIYSCGQQLSDLYFVASGIVALSYYEDDRRIISAIFLPGELLGLDAIDNQIHNNTALALIESLLLRVPYKPFLRFCHDHEDGEKSLLGIFSKQIFDASVLMEVLAHARSDVTVAFFIYSMAVRTGSHAVPEKRLRYLPPRRDLASHLGLAYETVSRQINDLCDFGIIKCQGKTILIENIDQLKRICWPYSDQIAGKQSGARGRYVP